MSRFFRNAFRGFTRFCGFEIIPYMVSLPKGSKINRLIIDSSDAATDLCKLGVEHPTDKSPYNTQRHRHPYTAVYDFLFAGMRYEPILFGEIGIEKNQSMICWRAYFSKAILYGWDFDMKKIVHGEAAGLPNTHYGWMNVKDSGSISSSLSAIGKQLDVLIDDSTHEFDDQIRVVGSSLPFLRPGAILVIEDIFQGHEGYGEDTYERALTNVKKYFSSILFVECRHKNRSSPGSNNDKLLVLFRNDVDAAV